jgi:membrane-bound serine protease (ClpP class)
VPNGVQIDPNIVYLALLIGLWSGVTAAYVPGTGVVELASAAISLAAVFMLAAMPTNWLAVLVVVIGVAGFLLTPLLNHKLATLATAGLILQAVGSAYLFEGVSVSLPLVAATIILSLLYHRFVLLPVLTSQRKHPNLNDDNLLLGARATVVNPINPLGTVRARGEFWQARSDEPLAAGEEAIVVDRDGLVLVVESLKSRREQVNGHSIEHKGR